MSEVRFREHRWPQLVVALLGSVLSLGLFALLLLPSLTSAAEAQVVEDPETFQIGSVAQLDPAAGWSVQPLVEGGALLPGDGLELRSPDRVLTVSLREASPGERLVSDSESHEDATASNTVLRVLTETLENGSELSHGTASADGHFVALLDLDGSDDGDARVFVEARTDEPEQLDDYRAELAALLLRVEAEPVRRD